MTLINPFSVALSKHPFMEAKSNPVYSNGDYRIFKHVDKHYLHTYKNIIIAERSGINKEMIDNLAANTPPLEGSLYHDFERPKQTILEGIAAAKKLDFQIINLNQLELF